jgi:cytochrome c-type biogenesis protein CcmH/NrfG
LYISHLFVAILYYSFVKKSIDTNTQDFLRMPLLGVATRENLLDWFITFNLVFILFAMVAPVGGAHIETHIFVLPLFVSLILLHGLYLLSNRDLNICLCRVPLYLLPLLLWIFINTLIFSPSESRGWQQFIYALEAYLFLWVAVNNLRTRAHFSFLLIVGILPVVVALILSFYQFFQKPSFVLNLLNDSHLLLDPSLYGRATGIFANPESFSILLLVVTPWAFVACSVPRLPTVLRILAFYILITLIVGVVLSQTFWALAVSLVGCIVAIQFCFVRTFSKVKITFLTVLTFALIVWALLFKYSNIQENYSHALERAGEGSRLVIWPETTKIFLEHPFFGIGGGGFEAIFAQSNTTTLNALPISPSSDFLLLLTEYGLLGFLLFAIPIYRVLYRASKSMYAEPARVRIKDQKKKIMPLQRFFLSIALGGAFSFFECFVLGSIWTAPILLLYAAIFLAALVKTSHAREFHVKRTAFRKVIVLSTALGTCCFISFFFIPKIRSFGLSHQVTNQLDATYQSGEFRNLNHETTDLMLFDLEQAINLYPGNLDAWLNLSKLHVLSYYQNPKAFQEVGQKAADAAQTAIHLSPNIWQGWLHLGIAEALKGDIPASTKAFDKVHRLAPNNAEANYYRAVFLSQIPNSSADAFEAIEMSIRMNPENKIVHRLKQKLLIK